NPSQPASTLPERRLLAETHVLARTNSLVVIGSPPPPTPRPPSSGGSSPPLHRTRFQNRHVPGRRIAAIATDEADQPGPVVVDARKAGAVRVLQRREIQHRARLDVGAVRRERDGIQIEEL